MSFLPVYFQIVALVEEISRLRSALAALQESHNLRIQQLEERLEAKRQHISRLEARLDKQSDYEDVKKENRYESTKIYTLKPIFILYKERFIWRKSAQWTYFDSTLRSEIVNTFSFIQNQHLYVNVSLSYKHGQIKTVKFICVSKCKLHLFY